MRVCSPGVTYFQFLHLGLETQKIATFLQRYPNGVFANPRGGGENDTIILILDIYEGQPPTPISGLYGCELVRRELARDNTRQEEKDA